MEKKIGKLGTLGEISRGREEWWIIDNLNNIIEKQNEIIDYLNSQDQEGYEKRIRIRGELSGETEHIKAHKEYLTTSKQDTLEEWVEKLWELIDMYRDSKDINSELERIEEVNQYVKQLLLEREREVLNSMREWVVEYHKDNWDIRDFDAEIAIGKIIDRELSKLTTK